jgi:hypothetical protein
MTPADAWAYIAEEVAFASLRFTEIAYVILTCSPPTIAAADVLVHTRAAARNSFSRMIETLLGDCQVHLPSRGVFNQKLLIPLIINFGANLAYQN